MNLLVMQKYKAEISYYNFNFELIEKKITMYCSKSCTKTKKIAYNKIFSQNASLL